MNYVNIFKFESIHLKRNSFKLISIVLFVLAAIYALQNGLNLYEKNTAEITKINIENDKANNKVLEWFDKGEVGPKDRSWVNITQPFWAMFYASSYAIKKPSPMMPFSIGQSEQFGYYKQITNWSTVYDADLSEEIANPERLTVGTLDFGFVLLCLFPILLIILVFNVGGTERDLDFMKLLQMQSDNIQKWLLVRYFFYFIFSVLLLLLLIIPCSLYLNVTFSIVLNYYLVCIGYILFWFIIFYYIALYSKSSADQSLKMIGVWLLFCVLLPGTIHQITNMKFTPSLMTDYLDANRKDTYALFELKPEVIKEMVTTAHPNLKNTAFSKDTIINTDITNNSSSALVNSIMKKAAKKLFDSNEKRNNFIKNTYVINPFGFFQNKLNAICSTDYYAFQNYKNQIQTAIDIKIKTMLLSEWNKEIIDKEKYKNFLKIATDEKK